MWSKGKILVNIFLITAALNTVSLNQFSKLPLLAIHYVDHWQKNKQMSFLDFVEMHYGGDDSSDNDNEQDQQLPLKSVSISAFQIFTAPSIPQIHYIPLTVAGNKANSMMRGQFVPTNIIADIFRPPKA